MFGIAENQNDKEISLLELRQYDTVYYFKLKDISIEKIVNKLKKAACPMADIAKFARSKGSQISEADSAAIEQGDMVNFSVTINLDERNLTVYEINKIQENDRTNKNTNIRLYSFDEIFSQF